MPGERLVDVPVTYQPQRILVEVPVQVEQQLQTFGPSSTVLGRRPREEDNGLFDVLIEEDFTVDVPVLFQARCVPSSSTVLGKRPHEENNETLRAPLGTFNASASTSRTTKKSRKSRSRRARFTPITLPKSPEIRAAIRAMYAAHKRALRNRDRATEPVLQLTAGAALRMRKSRASRTIEQRIQARSSNTLQQRSLRNRLLQSSRNVIPTPNENAHNFRKAIQQLRWGWCLECKTRFPDILAKGLCDFCKKDKRKHPGESLYSAANEMDPKEVPEVLSRLTELEKLLIARVHPVMSVYRVKGQQYKYGGNIINFAQDVNAIAKVLPCKPKDLSAILIVNKTGSRSTKEFVVRREYVRQALVWLQENHAHYHDIEISHDNINELPENDVPDELPQMNENHDQPGTHNRSGDQDQWRYPSLQQVFSTLRSDLQMSGDEIEDGDYNGPPELQKQVFHVDGFQTVGTVSATIQPDQQRCIRRALEIAEADRTTTDLPFTGEVIDEFTKTGYITMAFPTLFPYGTADLRQSRPRKVSACEYFQHLMKYQDGRFAWDSRFRYFAWNSLARWRALSLGSIYVNKYPSEGELSIQNIRDMVSSGNTSFLSRVSFYAKQIRGTRAYWYTRLKDLIAMVKQLGPPTIFFTLSAADLQWPELYALLDPENKLETLNPMERMREKGRLMNENPLVVSWFFQKRVSVFFKEYLQKEFDVLDYWYRFEWQNRGSGHVHGFLWLKDRPTVSHIATDEQVRRKLCEYFDNMVCTTNPNREFSVDIQNHHPCARKVPLESNLEDDDDDYASLVNCVMRHTKCGNYCLRISKTTGQQVCRFKFPKEISDVSKLVEEPPKSNMYRFVGKRDDDRVNSHNRQVLQTWRANIDWSAVTTVESVTQYIGKYAAKSEPASKTFLDTLRDIIDDHFRPCRDSSSAIKRLLIKSASERDISAQEVFHLLMGWPLTASSRKVFVLNLGENRLYSSSVRSRRDCDAEEQKGTSRSVFERYLARPNEFESTTLLQMAKKHYYVRNRWSTSRIEAIVRILPEFAGTVLPNTEKWESFCRQQVLLNSCYRSYEGAKRGFHLWSECYGDLGCATANQSPHIGTVDDEFEDESYPEDEPDQDWMLLSEMGPIIASESEILLGSRTTDLTHDWSEGFSRYPSIRDDRTFVHSLGKAEKETIEEYIPPDLDVALSSLSQQQKAAHDMVLQSMQTGSTIRLIVSGGAGTGKSTLINAIVHSTRQLFGKKNSVKIMGPTGVAAFNIGGATIHHELAIAVDKDREYKTLSPELCRRMKEDFRDTKLIVIDEYSMIGRNMFAKIDLRCRDVFANSEHFGNVSVVLVGDIRQLPPVFDTPLYFVGNGDSQLQILASLSYSLFKTCVRLEDVFRQSGDEELEFRDALRRLSDGKSTASDWRMFRTRDFSLLSAEEQNKFKFALRLFPTKSSASKYNYERLKELGNPVARITSKNNCEATRRATSDESKGLEEVLLLSKGSRVMLRKNLSTHYGLVNGSRGIIVDIVYVDGEKSPTHMPTAVMVNFDKYIGPKFQGSNVIPIIPETTTWKSTSGVTCTRTQLPFTLCWAITVHKSQGLTLDQAVVDIGPRESLGLTFVALSQTRKLRDLAFCPMFDSDRIMGLGKCKGLDLRCKEEERL